MKLEADLDQADEIAQLSPKLYPALDELSLGLLSKDSAGGGSEEAKNPRDPVNVLLVDDQPAKLLSYETILSSLGENLIRANSGKEALEHLLKGPIAVVLVDVCMPELDGFELAAMIRSHPRFQRTAIILVSSILVEDVDRLKGYDYGAVDYISVPIVPGLLRAKVAVFADLYRKTEALERLNRELELRVAERTAEIESARREAERANQLKDEFLAILSHELRTPLNAITGWAHMLLSGGLDSNTQVKAFETINRNALLQARLISDLLDVSRIVSGKLRLDPKPVTLSSVVQAALDAVRPQATVKPIYLDVTLSDVPPMIGDSARLQQIVSNLLANAIKFTPANGHVHVRLEQSGGNAEIIVQDDGPGIPPELLPHIFDRFRQGDTSTTRIHQGLGLGLTIVRRLVEMHGGTVQAMNREDRAGAVFSILLPVPGPSAATATEAGKSAATLAQPAAPLAPATALKGVRALIVDDEPDAREVVAALLEQCGAEVWVSDSVEQALVVFEREQPQVVVADIEMPGEDGYSLIRKIRNMPSSGNSQTPVIALTAHASTSDRIRLLDAGFDFHIPKPVQPAGLIASLVRVIGSGEENPSDTRTGHAGSTE
ncbi:MAG TPA: response regulator [Terriglobia bacterium]|nr:response regulator [Terriglobia bacterium]